MQIIEKPWGQEEIIEINDRYMMKRLTMWKGHSCSLQYHRHKKETIFVLSGRLRIILGPNEDELSSRVYTTGETITISPGEIHRMEGVDDSVYLEASTPEVDDVVRLADSYGRAAE